MSNPIVEALAEARAAALRGERASVSFDIADLPDNPDRAVTAALAALVDDFEGLYPGGDQYRIFQGGSEYRVTVTRLSDPVGAIQGDTDA